MALTPEEIDQRMMQADQTFKQKEYNQAVDIVNSIIEENPNYAPAHRRMGLFLMHSPSQEKALNHLKKALELVPDDGENWIALGVFHQRRKKWRESLEAFHQALRYRPEDGIVLYKLLQIYRTIKNFQAALTIIEKLRKIDPENIQYHWQHAQLLQEAGKNKEALQEYDHLVESEREDIPVEAIEEWYELIIDFGSTGKARRWLKEVSEKHPDDVRLKLLYARSCAANFDDAEAQRLLLELYKTAPENEVVNYKLGISYEQVGDRRNAMKYLGRACDLNPFSVSALRALGSLNKYDYGDEAFRKLNFAAAHLDKMPTNESSQLHYALGKAFDDVGDLATAFEHYKEGGRLRSQGNGEKEYHTFQITVNDIRQKIGEDFFKQNRIKGYESQKPIFILGMPRSGTSLMEQVLSGIDGIYGAGELKYGICALNHIDVNGFKLNISNSGGCFSAKESPDYRERGEKYMELIEALAPDGTRRIIDKAPGNFKWIGLLHLILPNAKFIHSRRHPVETCLSAYRIHFASRQHWSDDLQTMGKYYRLYAELMAHWQDVLPKGMILDVRYEDMVADLEGESKRIAAHIGIEWDASCLDFHQSKRAVRTASVSQVRQPIYTTSVNRWHKYEPYLKPLLDEIGDLVEAYEAEGRE